MKYVTAITPICFLIHSKDGFTELCEYLQCIPSDEYWELLKKGEREKISTIYPYTLLCVENGSDEANNDEFSISMPTRKIGMSEMEYPCIITMVDDTFECNSYTFHTRQISSELASHIIINEVK